MRQKITSHFGYVVGREGDFCKPIFESPILRFRRRLFQQHSLVRWSHEKTGLRAVVLRTAGCQSEDIGIELTGLADVAGIDSYVINAGDSRAMRLPLLSEQGKLQPEEQRKRNERVSN